MRPLEDLLAAHPVAPPEGGKDERGTVLVLGGPEGCPGGVLLAGQAALRAGAGRLQLGVHPAVAPHVAVAMPEAFVLAWDPAGEPSADVQRAAGSADVLVIGPGYSDGLADAAPRLAAGRGRRPLVLDAGALDAVPDLAADHGLVLAPNTDEAAQLTGSPGSEAELAEALGERFACPIAVRGPQSVVTDGAGGLWHHDHGASALGTPGSGDVLVGVLAGLLARALPPVAALGWAVALHGRTGEILERTTPVGYLARDLLDQLPFAFLELGAAGR